MKTFYRLEIYERGIYQWKNIPKWQINFMEKEILLSMNDDHDRDFRNHPPITHDGFFDEARLFNVKIENGITGCRTISELKDWFGDYFEKLLKINGVQLVKYKSPLILIGRSKKQVLAFSTKRRKVIDYEKIKIKNQKMVLESHTS